MTMPITPQDLDRLAAVLDANRGKPVSDSNIAKLAAKMQANAVRDAEELKMLTPTFELMNERFTI